MTVSLRIVTINTGKGDGPFTQRLQLLASGLRQLQPDVVFLQEALSIDDDNKHTVNMLAAHLDMTASYAPARHKQRSVEGEIVLCSSGLGILTNHTVAASEILSLPSDPSDGERVAQLVALEAHSARVLLANIHLSHLRERGALRRSQLATLVAHPWFGQDWSAQFIGGDFNTSVEMLPDLLKGLGEWNWNDGYAKGDGNADRATLPVNQPPADGRCIDFILSVSRDPDSHPRFQDAAVVLHEPKNAIFPSDHRGVMVTAHIDKEAR